MLPWRRSSITRLERRRALDLLESVRDDGRCWPAGQSLIPLLKLRFASPGHLVDINKIKTWTLSRSVTAPCGSARYFATKAAERSSLLASR